MKLENRMPKVRQDYATIAQWIEPGARVLDFGCGDGGLLRYLTENNAIEGYGVEIDDEKVSQSIKNGVNVIQSDLETGSSLFDTNSFDFVILSLTLQAVRHTERVVLEMLRIGRQCIVTFPNFGFWQNRSQVLLGKMPISRELPYQWYNTPNVHLFTVHDFEQFCQGSSIHIMDKLVLDRKGRQVKWMPNLMGTLAFYRFSRKN